MLDVNTNIVKLRSNIWAANTFPIQHGGDAGDFIRPHAQAGCVGVLVEDAEEGADGLVVHQANRIIVPCNFTEPITAGTLVAFEIGENRVTSVANGDLLCGVLLEDMPESDYSDAEECMIYLLGIAMAV